MSRRRLNRKPNRFSRTSKPRGVLKRYKLRGGTKEEDLEKIYNFSIEFAKLRDNSNIIGIKAEIAEMLKLTPVSLDSDRVDQKYAEYTAALTQLIEASLKLATTTYANDSEVTSLKDKVANLMSVAIPDNAKYYDLRDVYDTIADFFAKKAINLMSGGAASNIAPDV